MKLTPSNYIMKMHERAKKKMDVLKKRQEAHKLEGIKLSEELAEIQNLCPHHSVSEYNDGVERAKHFCDVCGLQC